MDDLIVLKPQFVLADPPQPPLGGRAVVVRGERIEAVVPIGEIPADAKILEFPGATLMPGLIDAHVHLTLCGCCAPRQTMMQENNEMLLLRAAENARLALLAGITTLRDCGDRDGITFTLREAILRGLVPGPRLLLSGPPLTSPRGHCYFMGGEVEGREHIARTIAGLVARGANFIKVMATGGGLTPGTDSLALQFTPDDLAFIVSEAGKTKRYVAAHAHSPESIRVCVDAGVRTVEHASFVASGAVAADDSILEVMARAGAIAVPTNIPAVHAIRAGRMLGLARQIGLSSEQFLEGRRQVLRDLIASGVRVIAGSDAGATGVPFDSLLGEIELLAEGFGSVSRAIAAATSESAYSLGLADAGRVREGMAADLLILAENPENDLQTLRKPLLVMSRGRIQ
ncbi:MAG TPA: amidohydrolase family protein [Bryobacteraceae bacterium]|jgi:imidazolonepropionase-like amidohydrolase